MSLDLLMLTRYGPLGASSRVRAYQFLPSLEAAGFRVQVAPLLGDAYLRRLYTGDPNSRAFFARAYARRIRDVVAARGAGLVWIEKELLPWAPGWFETGLLAGIPYVVDYDDAVFHTYDDHPNPAVRRFLGGKIDAVMRGAALVVAGNAYLAARAEAAGARRVEILPSVIDLTRYQEALPANPDRPFTVGWIGSAGSDRALDAIQDVLRELTQAGTLRLRLIGSEGRRLKGVSLESRPWSEETEVEEIRQLDAGIMPLPDETWTRGKCGYKLIQYMGCALPVIASPIGVNEEIVGQGVCGFLASTADEWRSALLTLRSDVEARQAMGQHGRARVEQRYSLRVAEPRMIDLLQSVRPR